MVASPPAAAPVGIPRTVGRDWQTYWFQEPQDAQAQVKIVIRISHPAAEVSDPTKLIQKFLIDSILAFDHVHGLLIRCIHISE